MARTEAQKRASAKYNKDHTKLFTMRLQLNGDEDIMAYLDTLPNKQGRVKELIRADIARANSGKKEEEQTMKKIYDLRINSHGKAQPMSDGFFASTAALVNGYNEADYITREFSDCTYRISKRDLDRPCIQDFLARKAKKEEEKNMKKHMVQFEAGEGREISGGVNYLICLDIPELYAEIAVPDGASDDYGYLTLKARILEQARNLEIDTDTLEFWYDGQEDKLAADASAE